MISNSNFLFRADPPRTSHSNLSSAMASSQANVAIQVPSLAEMRSSLKALVVDLVKLNDFESQIAEPVDAIFQQIQQIEKTVGFLRTLRGNHVYALKTAQREKANILNKLKDNLAVDAKIFISTVEQIVQDDLTVKEKKIDIEQKKSLEENLVNDLEFVQKSKFDLDQSIKDLKNSLEIPSKKISDFNEEEKILDLVSSFHDRFNNLVDLLWSPLKSNLNISLQNQELKNYLSVFSSCMFNAFVQEIKQEFSLNRKTIDHSNLWHDKLSEKMIENYKILFEILEDEFQFSLGDWKLKFSEYAFMSLFFLFVGLAFRDITKFDSDSKNQLPQNNLDLQKNKSIKAVSILNPLSAVNLGLLGLAVSGALMARVLSKSYKKTILVNLKNANIKKQSLLIKNFTNQLGKDFKIVQARNFDRNKMFEMIELALRKSNCEFQALIESRKINIKQNVEIIFQGEAGEINEKIQNLDKKERELNRNFSLLNNKKIELTASIQNENSFLISKENDLNKKTTRLNKILEKIESNKKPIFHLLREKVEIIKTFEKNITQVEKELQGLLEKLCGLREVLAKKTAEVKDKKNLDSLTPEFETKKMQVIEKISVLDVPLLFEHFLRPNTTKQVFEVFEKKYLEINFAELKNLIKREKLDILKAAQKNVDQSKYLDFLKFLHVALNAIDFANIKKEIISHKFYSIVHETELNADFSNKAESSFEGFSTVSYVLQKDSASNQHRHVIASIF